MTRPPWTTTFGDRRSAWNGRPPFQVAGWHARCGGERSNTLARGAEGKSRRSRPRSTGLRHRRLNGRPRRPIIRSTSGLLGKSLLDDKHPRSIVMKVVPAATCPRPASPVRHRNSTARPAPIRARCGHDAPNASRNRTHLRRLGPCCPAASPMTPRERATCWPASESTTNMNTKRGRLGLPDTEEDALVSFLQRLTSGFMALVRK
jgi:hypothetical protein